MSEIRDVVLADYHAPQVLVCPRCGCDFLHQSTVGVYSGRMLPERRMEHQVIVSDTDVVDGYVSRTQAEESYGVIFDQGSFEIDKVQTQNLRSRLADEQPR